MSTNPRIKYRPSLNAANINHILTLAKTEAPLSQNSLDLIAVLAPFAAKIENMGVKPAYTKQAPKPSTLHLLGGPEDKPSNEYTIFKNGAHFSVSKEEYWEWCYTLTTNSLYADTHTAERLLAAREHMYLNDLFNAEEKAAFEAGTMGDTNTNG